MTYFEEYVYLADDTERTTRSDEIKNLMRKTIDKKVLHYQEAWNCKITSQFVTHLKDETLQREYVFSLHRENQPDKPFAYINYHIYLESEKPAPPSPQDNYDELLKKIVLRG